MSAQATQAAHPDDPGPQAAATHSLVLDGLIHIGADLARLLHQQATAQAGQAQPTPAPRTQPKTAPHPAPAPSPDALISIAAAFDRIARAVRRCILLARSLAEPAPPARDPAAHRAAARKRIIRDVEDAIQRTARGPNATDALRAELHDRLDAPDLDWDLADRPIAEIIAEICRDLGLASLAGDQRWKRRTPDDIAELYARAAAPSRQPGATPPGLTQDAAQRPPAEPPAVAQTAPASAYAATDPPDDAAAVIATIPRHPARHRGHWRPPPGA